MSKETIAWLLLAFWLTVVAALACAVWFYRNYPEQQALLARADEQHAKIMSGDIDGGTYGLFMPPEGLR